MDEAATQRAPKAFLPPPRVSPPETVAPAPATPTSLPLVAPESPDKIDLEPDIGIGEAAYKMASADLTGDIPQNINFAIRGELAKLFLTKHNVGFEIEMSLTKLEPATLAEHAGKYTVLISCWGGWGTGEPQEREAVGRHRPACGGGVWATPLSCSVIKLARSVVYPCPSAEPLSPLSEALWRRPHLPFIPTKTLIIHG